MSNETMTLKVIAHIHTAFPTKFGIPRQSGLVDGLRGEIIFTPEYRNADALRGLEDFSHIWLVWQFSGAVRESWSPTVRPPRLGGNTRMGVFATRSPFRPNPLGLSSVRLEAIEHRPEVGPVLIVRGADLMDGTPIYDIKPYIPYADCHPDAAAGFTAQTQTHRLQVECPPELWESRTRRRAGRPAGRAGKRPPPLLPARPGAGIRHGIFGIGSPFCRRWCCSDRDRHHPPLRGAAVELRTINTFLHIAELHSFSRAARELGYSQSAVSAQVAQLEAELETPLFDRVGKTVRLTDAGQTFLTYARSLLATAEQAKAALQPARQVSGTLRVALADSVCSTFLPDLLQRYHALCPQVELVLRTATDDEMLQMLGSNQIDLAYTLDKPLLQPSFVLAVDEPEPICVVAPAGHPLAGQAEVTLQELAGQEFLLTERGMSYRDALDQCMAAQGLAIKPFLELGSASLLCQMVEHGMGLSFLPEYIVQNALAAGTLSRLNVPACRVEMRRQLFYHKDKWLTPQMKAFITLVQR